MAARGRFWCFTENDEPDALRALLLEEGLPDGIRYLCGQLEEAGHRHFQGYLELPVTRRVAWLKSNLSPTAHFERRMGDQEQAIDYTRKEDDTTIEGTWIELGELATNQGKRNDLLEIKAKLDDGMSMLQVAEDHFGSWCHARRSLEAYVQMKQTKRDINTAPIVEVHFGPPGVGKTALAWTRYPDLYTKSPKNKWWDGYVGQDTVLLDDFKAWFPWSYLMQLLDRYPMQVETKGGFVHMRATRFIITCNVHPAQWYHSEKCPFEALARRVTDYFDWTSGTPVKSDLIRPVITLVTPVTPVIFNKWDNAPIQI